MSPTSRAPLLWHEEEDENCDSSYYGEFTKYLGKGHDTKSDEFSEKFQTAFDPLPSFLENNIALFF